MPADIPEIYLDNAASTPVHPRLQTELPELVGGNFANAAAAHCYGRQLRQRLEAAATSVRGLLGAAADRLLWLSGGTEANNLAIFGSLPGSGPLGVHFVTTATEHPSVLAPLAHLETRGAKVSVIPVDHRGALDLERLRRELQPSTAMVAVGLVQGETGTVQDLPAVRRVMDEVAPRARLLVDAVQGVGKLPLPWADARIDLLSLSGHKFHGPGGVGALLVRQGLALTPQLFGGGQQDNLRSGSLDGAGIVACSRALQYLTDDSEVAPRIVALNQQLRAGLTELPVTTRINSPAGASPWILNVSFPGFQGAVLMRMLADEGIMVATGSACSADAKTPSKILSAMGLSHHEAFGALRISFGIQNTPADVDRLLAVLRRVLADY